MKKRVLIFSLIIIFMFVLTACTDLELSGLENYNINNSETSLSQKLLPHEKFIDMFDYEDGDYFYQDTGLEIFPVHSLERELLYLTYDESKYENAKNSAINNMLFSKENTFSYNGYEFVENITYADENGETDEFGENKYFPYRFNMFAFNDEKRTLVFLSFYIHNPTDEEKQILRFENIEVFLKRYYPFYSF